MADSHPPVRAAAASLSASLAIAKLSTLRRTGFPKGTI